ncbi:hypothetical protein TSUD_219250 [Trifolium subterraneum]|uniref:Uncharacterized protein n=1 Tax=Trifolium subterraneum TaxID=3900 RepID=A0A2Z6ND01_TRISU|nr:hypothetical protein TSUD_219250 [Trifolium subterraneum]
MSTSQKSSPVKDQTATTTTKSLAQPDAVENLVVEQSEKKKNVNEKNESKEKTVIEELGGSKSVEKIVQMLMTEILLKSH